MKCRIDDSPLAVLLLPLLFALLLYGHTLHVPFYLDDNGAIRDNLLIRDLWSSLEQFVARRGVANTSFALNYWFTGLSLPALHLTNISIHVAAASMVGLLLRRLLPGRALLAILGALIFVAHPLQTQAVTYLVQRATSLSGLLFLLAFYLYLSARSVLVQGRSWRSSEYLLPYSSAVLIGALAVLTKENAATLPLVILFFERLFPLGKERCLRRDILAVLPFCIAPLGVALVTFAQTMKAVDTPGGLLLHDELASLAHNTPLNYLATQFQVVWIYLRLFLLPYGQALEHNYQVVSSYFDPLTLFGLAGLIFLWWIGWRIRDRRPLMSFGIAWFFVTLLVESSVIPLDPLFEHRLYLPMFGLVIFFLDGMPVLFCEKFANIVLLVFLVVCVPVTWARNSLWNDPLAFHEDNLAKVPSSERTRVALAKLYNEQGRKAEAQSLLEEVLQINPESSSAYKNLALFHVMQGREEEAVALLDKAIQLKPHDPDRYEATALLMVLLRRRQEAVDYLLRGIANNPQSEALYNNLGVTYAGMDQWAEAERAYRQSLALASHNPRAHDNLGEALIRQGRMAEASKHFRLAAEQLPGDSRLLLNAGIAAHRSGDRATLEWAAARLKRFDLVVWRELMEQTTLR